MIKFVSIILIFLISSNSKGQIVIDEEGALIRSDTSKRIIFLCFTGHDYDDGFDHVISTLNKHKIEGSFFLTGDFIRTHNKLVRKLVEMGHYVGAHSDKHLLYCDWDKRDSLLYHPKIIKQDISNNLELLEEIGVSANFFIPPFEWYNREVVAIARELGQTTANFSPGTRSNADYTTPDMGNYISSIDILQSIYQYEAVNGMNGFHLLIHPGVHPDRKDKLYLYLDDLVVELKKRNYRFSIF